MPQINVSLLDGELIFIVDGDKVETRDIADEIRSITLEMTGEFLAVAGRRLTEAREYLESAVEGDADRKLMRAIEILIEAHDHIATQLDKKVEKRLFLLLKMSEDAIENKRSVCNCCTRLAIIIHELHCVMQNFENEEFWYMKVLDDIQAELRIFCNDYGDYKTPTLRISQEAYDRLTAISLYYANERIKERTRHIGYYNDGFEASKTERIAEYTLTSAGQKYCEHQERLIRETAQNKLDKSLKLLPLTEHERQSRRLTMLADHAYTGKRFWDAALLKMENAAICRSQGEERDAHLLETSAYAYMIEEYNVRPEGFNLEAFNKNLEYIKNIPNADFQEGLLNAMADIAIENRYNHAAAEIKIRIAELCRAKGDDHSAELLEVDAENLRG